MMAKEREKDYIRICEEKDDYMKLEIEKRRRNDLKFRLLRLVISCVLITSLITLSYSGHCGNNFPVTRNIRDIFRLNGYGQGKITFKTQEHVYQYLETVLLDGLYPTELYEGQDIPSSSSGLIADQKTALVGIGRIRQQRVKPAKCSVSGVDALLLNKIHCTQSLPYVKSRQDRESYDSQWQPLSDSEPIDNVKFEDGWKFHGEDSDKPQSLTFQGHQGIYDGGGYILEMGRTRKETEDLLKYMKRTLWLDQRTRAIFVEFTLFNPNVAKFVDVVLLIEQAPTWSFTFTSWVTPIELISIDHLKNSDELVGISVCIALITLCWILWISLFIREMMQTHSVFLIERSAFWLDLLIIIFVCVTMGVCSKRFVVARELTDKILSQSSNEYVSIQEATLWNDIRISVNGVTQAIVFARCWMLFMYTDKRFLAFALTLKLSIKFLLGFLLLLSFFLNAFAMAGFFIFGQYLWQFSSWSESITSLVDQILKGSNIRYFLKVDRFLGPIYSILFGFLVIFVGLNFVASVLNLSIHEAKEVVHQRRVWLTFFQYFLHLCRKCCPAIASRSQMVLTAGKLNLSPRRLEGMKQVTATFLRDFIYASAKESKLKEMEGYCNKILKGSGFKVVSKRRKAITKKLEKKEHIEDLGNITRDYVSAKIGRTHKPEEFKQFADFNRKIVRERVHELEWKLEELDTKVTRFLRILESRSSVRSKSTFSFLWNWDKMAGGR